MSNSASETIKPSETQADFGRRLGVSRQRVNAMIKMGMPILANGRLDIESSLDWVRRNVEPRRGGANRPSESVDDGNGDDIDLTEARRLKILVDTEIARVILARELGSLLDKEQVRKATAAYFRLIRDKLVNFPNRFGQQVAAAAGAPPALIMAELDKVIRLQLAEIANSAPRYPTKAEAHHEH